MNAWLRLLRVEARRNPGLWLFPLVAIMIVYTTTETLPKGIRLWPETSVSLRETIVLVGPLAGGLAAWAAIRDRRRGIEELLATTPRPAAVRSLANWGATTAWYVLAYLVAATSIFVWVYLDGVWGSPAFWPILLGLFALLADSALGYAAGSYVPSRFTVPLVAITFYWVQGVTIAYLDSSAAYLSPVVGLNPSVFYGVLPNIFVEQSLWLLGIAGAAVAVVMLKGGNVPAFSRGAFVASVVVAMMGAVMLLKTPVLVTPSQEQRAFVPYESVCAEEAIPVCVHPAYEGMLRGTADTVVEVAAPLLGIPGGPVQAEQAPHSGTELKPDGTLSFFLHDATLSGDQLAEDVALGLVRDDATVALLTDAQAVVGGWLLQRTDRDPGYLIALAGEENRELSAAVNRFGKLSPKERRDWLRQNYAGLRTGKVTLKDLP